MKKLILAVAIIASTSVQAKELSHCERVESISRTIMKNRQADIPLIKMVKAVDSEPVKALILMAYKKPLWSTSKRKEKAINKFANDLYMTCLSNKER